MDDPVRPGDILAQKYRVERVLGVGGMGVVVAATHLELEQRVALKFMLGDGFKTPDALTRFQREARIAVKLRSEHVARVSDTGTLENGAPYIVMEYLEGTDLGAQLAQYGPMPVGFAAECIVQACDAVGEAHAHGIVHRDLKPANLFLTQTPDGSALVKVLDFGISKASNGLDSGMAMTKTGTVMGSPLYMSPEQMRSLKNVDARADVWALGVIMYELLTGQTPFIGDSFGDLLLAVMTTPHPPIRQLRPDVPLQIAALVDACLAKEPTVRVQSVAEIAQVLAPFCSAAGIVLAQRITALARKAGTTGDPRAAASATGAGWGSTHREQPRSKQVWLGAVVGIVVLAGGILVGVVLLGRSHPQVDTSTGSNSASVASAGASTAVPASAPQQASSAIATTAPAAGSVPALATSTSPPAPAAADSQQAPTTPKSGPAPAAKPRTTPTTPPAPHVAEVAPAPHPPAPPAAKQQTAPGILDTSN
jgi:serine/threonine protein kinase